MKAPGAATQSSLELVEVQLQLIHDLDKHPPSVSILQCPVKTLNLFPPFHCFCKSGEHIVFSLCLFVARADCEGFYSAARVACIFLHLAKQKKKKKKLIIIIHCLSQGSLIFMPPCIAFGLQMKAGTPGEKPHRQEDLEHGNRANPEVQLDRKTSCGEATVLVTAPLLNCEQLLRTKHRSRGG